MTGWSPWRKISGTCHRVHTPYASTTSDLVRRRFATRFGSPGTKADKKKDLTRLGSGTSLPVTFALASNSRRSGWARRLRGRQCRSGTAGRPGKRRSRARERARRISLRGTLVRNVVTSDCTERTGWFARGRDRELFPILLSPFGIPPAARRDELASSWLQERPESCLSSQSPRSLPRFSIISKNHNPPLELLRSPPGSRAFLARALASAELIASIELCLRAPHNAGTSFSTAYQCPTRAPRVPPHAPDSL